MPSRNVNDGPAKVWIFAGESSGDAYGAALARELRRQRPELGILGMGGSQMAEAGVEILVDSSELGVVGVIEVLKHIGTFRRIFRELLEQAEATRPDLVILIDYPGFNLRFARKLHRLGIKTLYYVSPQVWAWGKGRIPEMARMLSGMLVIFPFEVAIWEQAGLPCRFVGHPLVEQLVADESPVTREDKTVLLLPGSRGSEVDRLLAPIYGTAVQLHRQDPSLRFVLAAPRPAVQARIETALAVLRARQPGPPIELVCGETLDWMKRATVGIAASGTTTVQCAILGLPIVVVYRVNALTYLLGRLLVDVPYITMVNLVAKREVYQEYLQGQVNPRVLSEAVGRIMPGGSRRESALAGMQEAVDALQSDQRASVAAAQAVCDVLDGKSLA